MNWYPLLKFLHIAAVIVGVGGVFARQLVRARARNANDVRLLAALSHAARQIDSMMVIPGTTAILLFGVVLALLGGVPMLGFLQGASQNWLLVANILLIGIIAIIPTVLVPAGKRLEQVLQTALAKGEITAELRAALDDNRTKLAHWYEEIALIAIAALMVLKPF